MKQKIKFISQCMAKGKSYKKDECATLDVETAETLIRLGRAERVSEKKPKK